MRVRKNVKKYMMQYTSKSKKNYFLEIIVTTKRWETTGTFSGSFIKSRARVQPNMKWEKD